MTIVLHHYPESLFSEKIRLLLGYFDLDWRSVIIPNIMPRPELMPLSGGYRKTPILQIDANVYCDTRVIARALARHAGRQELFEGGFAALRTADWADTELFRLTVAMNFRPEALAGMFAQISPEQATAFQEDRAKLAEGGNIVSVSPAAAALALEETLADLEFTLETRDFLLGDAPSIADFAVYHCLWFLGNNPVNASWLEGREALGAWRGRMAAFGHARSEPMSAADALALGRAAEPVLPELDAVAPPDGLELGEPVTVTPTDYGRIPVAGVLRALSAHELVIERDDPDAGRIMVHFPTAGFELASG